MMDATQIVIKERPISWQHAYAHRAFARGKLVKFMTEKAKTYKELVRQTWINTFGEQSFYKEIPLEAEVILILKGKRKLDIDNSTKLIFDSLNGLAYDDDSQIERLFINKRHFDLKDKDCPETDIVIITFRPLYKYEDNVFK